MTSFTTAEQIAALNAQLVQLEKVLPKTVRVSPVQVALLTTTARKVVVIIVKLVSRATPRTRLKTNPVL